MRIKESLAHFDLSYSDTCLCLMPNWWQVYDANCNVHVIDLISIASFRESFAAYIAAVGSLVNTIIVMKYIPEHTKSLTQENKPG